MMSTSFMENTTLRTAISIFKGFFDGPWIYYKEVPPDVWEGCWTAFMERFQPESPDLLDKMRYVWERGMKRRYSGTLAQARNESLRRARRTSIAECADYPPPWINAVTWREMVQRWSMPSWKNKSEIAANNRQAPLQGCGYVSHSGGPVPQPVWAERMAKEMEKQPTFKEVYDRTHKRKGTNDFIDERAEKASGNYGAALSDKYGDDPSAHPNFDAGLWIPASGGVKKGRILGLSEEDSAMHLRACGMSSSASRYSGAAATGREFSSANEVEEVRREMNQRLEEAERRHQDNMHEVLEQVEQRHQQQMQAMQESLSRLAALVGLPSGTFGMPRSSIPEDGDHTHVGGEPPSSG